MNYDRLIEFIPVALCVCPRTPKVTARQCFLSSVVVIKLGVMRSTHFHYIKWPVSRCSTQRRIIPASAGSLSVSWISGLSGIAVIYLPSPSAFPLLSYSLQAFTHSLLSLSPTVSLLVFHFSCHPSLFFCFSSGSPLPFFCRS